MKKKITKVHFFFLLTLLLVLGLCGCSSQEAQEAPTVDPIEITISIDYPGKSADLKDQPFRVEEESSVLEVVELYGNVNDVSVLVDTTNSTLEGIHNVINHVTYKTCAWQYSVNGKMKTKEIDKFILEDGDHLELVYAKEPQ